MRSSIKLGPNLFIGNQNRTMHMNNRKMHKLKYRKARPEAEQLRRTILYTFYLIRLINIDKSKYMSRPKSGAAKSQTEATFYQFHNTYYTALLTYPGEVKTRFNTSACDESGPVLTKGLPPFFWNGSEE